MKIWQKQGFIYVSASLLAASTWSCDSKAEAAVVKDYSVKNGVISLTQDSQLHSRLTIAEVGSELTQLDQLSSGLVRAIPTHFAEIASPFAGRITKSFVRLGQNVQKGTPIFEISSSDFFAAQQGYFTAVQEMKQAELNWKRQKDLVQHGVGVQRELEEAQTDYQIKKIAVDNEKAALKIFNVNPNQLRIGQSLVVTSPIAGKIVSNHLVLGQYLREDSEALVQVAELSKVWVAAKVKENNLSVLKNLTEIQFTIEAYPNQTFTGKILHIGDLLDEESRSVEVLIEVENPNRILKPGMYVNVTLKQGERTMVVIPTKAVFLENDTQYVYVQKDKNQFEKRKITTSTLDPAKVIVLEGLSVGEKIVVDGGTYLLQAK